MEDERKTKTDSTPGAPAYSSYPSDETAMDEPKRSVVSPPARVTFATTEAREGDQLCAYEVPKQEDGLEEPAIVEFVPRGHEAQTAAPGATAYDPRGHREHVVFEKAPVTELDVPAGHDEHVVIDAAPTNEEKVPVAQGVQAALEVAPTAEEYVPEGHGLGLIEESGQ